MIPHQTMISLDGSVARRPKPGGPWEVKSGPTNGQGDIFNCGASVFVDAQNKFVGDSHEDAVRDVRARERGT